MLGGNRLYAIVFLFLLTRLLPAQGPSEKTPADVFLPFDNERSSEPGVQRVYKQADGKILPPEQQPSGYPKPVPSMGIHLHVQAKTKNGAPLHPDEIVARDGARAVTNGSSGRMARSRLLARGTAGHGKEPLMASP